MWVFGGARVSSLLPIPMSLIMWFSEVKQSMLLVSVQTTGEVTAEAFLCKMVADHG